MVKAPLDPLEWTVIEEATTIGTDGSIRRRQGDLVDIIVLIGRIMFVFVFLSSGLAHFTSRQMMSQYAASKKVPAALPAVLGGGVLLIAGGISILFGIWADVGALLLVIFLLPTAVLIHNFWTVTDPQERMMEMTQFSKDLGLAGAALMLFAFFAYVGEDLGLTLTGPLFNLR